VCHSRTWGGDNLASNMFGLQTVQRKDVDIWGTYSIFENLGTTATWVSGQTKRKGNSRRLSQQLQVFFRYSTWSKHSQPEAHYWCFCCKLLIYWPKQSYLGMHLENRDKCWLKCSKWTGCQEDHWEKEGSLDTLDIYCFLYQIPGQKQFTLC